MGGVGLILVVGAVGAVGRRIVVLMLLVLLLVVVLLLR